MRKMHILTVLLVFVSSLVMADLTQAMTDGKVELQSLDKYKRALALDFAQQMQKDAFRAYIQERLSKKNPACSLMSFIADYTKKTQDLSCKNLAQSVAKLDQGIRAVKGIEKRLASILEVRVAVDAMADRLNEDVLVAYVPKGDEKDWVRIEAFDKDGNVHYLDVVKEPKQAVLVVGLDASEDKRAGLALLNDELQKAGLQPKAETNSRDTLAVAKLDYIRLNDDKEPWLLGDAEIYTLVNGIAPEANKASVLSVDMPYIDKDDKDYRPGQVVIVWKNYRYAAANLNIFEHDDNTNYKEIALRMIETLGKVSTKYQAIFDIGTEIIRLMPDKWFSNDDDYVDVFYTLEKNKTYTNHYGASNNAKITLVPYSISSMEE